MDMELLPIIYWSLIGFGFLVLLATLASYTTYQIRKKLGKTPEKVYRNNQTDQEIRVKFPDRRSLPVKQHHPKVVRKHNIYEHSAKQQRRKSRITILNDLIRNDE